MKRNNNPGRRMPNFSPKYVFMIPMNQGPNIPPKTTKGKVKSLHSSGISARERGEHCSDGREYDRIKQSGAGKDHRQWPRTYETGKNTNGNTQRRKYCAGETADTVNKQAADKSSECHRNIEKGQ